MKPRRPCFAGEVYGRWTVLIDSKVVGGKHKAKCQCSCGTIKDVLTISLLDSRSTSCGCFHREQVAKLAATNCTTHGHAGKGKRTRAYYAWKGMKTRCFNQNSARYADYGGRGVTVCLDWKESFQKFLDDMGEPGEGMTLDRKDNDGDYTPENCHWVTIREQQNNKRSNRIIEFNGVKQNLTQWANDLSIPMKTLHKRLSSGWGIQEAFTKELR